MAPVPRTLITAIIAVALACQVRNPDWCDASHPCADGRACDVDGTSPASHGVKNSCIGAAPGAADAGTADAGIDAGVPCADAGTCPASAPTCRRGLCAPCTGGADCPAAAPVCRGDGSCGPCAMDRDCMLAAGRPHCASSGACVACLAPSDCPVTDPVCATGDCGPCKKEQDCAARGATPHCGDGGACVACRQSADCTSLAAPKCSAASTCGPCTGESDCAGHAATPHCDQQGACVECRTSADCGGDTPVCDAAHTCQPCTQDADCPDLCDEDSGACVAPASILFVSPGTSGDCSKGSPCGAIGTAVGKVAPGAKRWIKVAPANYSEALNFNGVTVEVVGPGATVVPILVASNTPAALVRAGSNVTLRGLKLAGASGGTSADGVLCAGAAAATTRITLREVRLDGNGHRGLDAQNCTVDLERSFVTGNGAGGVSLFSCDFSLVNNFIVGNGLATAPFGGVEIDQDPPSGGAAGRLLFNTIADNSAPGVKCTDQTAALTFSDNIVWKNGNAGQVLSSGASCAWTYSDIGPTAVTGTGNKNADPQFMDPSSGEYHLMTKSPCVNAADPAATVMVDYDGDLRPAGGRADIGADEAP
jgi:hypothetical protein